MGESVSLSNLKHLRLLCEVSREIAREQWSVKQEVIAGPLLAVRPNSKQIGIDWLRNSCENAKQIFDAQSEPVTEELRRLVFLICYDLLQLFELEIIDDTYNIIDSKQISSPSSNIINHTEQRLIHSKLMTIPLLLKSSKLFMFSDSPLLDCRPQMLGKYYSVLARVLLSNELPTRRQIMPEPMEQMAFLLQSARVELTLSSSISMLPWCKSFCTTPLSTSSVENGRRLDVNCSFTANATEDEMLINFLNLNTENPLEKERRVQFEDSIIRLVHETLGVRCYKYGSNLTEFTDKESDIDLGVDVNECETNQFLKSLFDGSNTRQQQLPQPRGSPSNGPVVEKPLSPSALARLFSERLAGCMEFKNNMLGQEPRPSAKKPMVRIYTRPGSSILLSREHDTVGNSSSFSLPEVGLSADVSFSRGIPGLRNSSLLKHYSSLDSRVKPLVVLLKQWSRYRAVNGCYFGYLSSFAHTLTMIYFLQSIQPPVLPNIQMPNPSIFNPANHNTSQPFLFNMNRKTPTAAIGVNRRQDQSFVLSSFDDEKLCEDHTVFQTGHDNATNGIQFPWTSWTSKNTMTIRQLFTEYFRFMAIEFPSGGYIISPRVGPYMMSKTSRFIANNFINAPQPPLGGSNHAPTKKRKKKKIKKIDDRNISSSGDNRTSELTDSTTVDSQTTITSEDNVTHYKGKVAANDRSGHGGGCSSYKSADIPEGVNPPIERQSVENWIHKHPDHSIQTFVQSMSEDSNAGGSYDRIMIEDPCENERILQPTRPSCNEQMLLEYLRAWWFLESGLGIFDLMKDIVPRRTSIDDPSPVDFYHMRKLPWFHQTFDGWENPPAAEVIRKVRQCIWAKFMNIFSRKISDINNGVYPHGSAAGGSHANGGSSKLLSYYICHRAFLTQWAHILKQIEADFTRQFLVRNDRRNSARK